MNSNGVDSINRHPFDLYMFDVGVFAHVNKNSNELVIKQSKFTLYMKDQANQTLEQRLLTLKVLNLQYLCHFTGNEIKTIQ